jgi:hypothetical protein
MTASYWQERSERADVEIERLRQAMKVAARRALDTGDKAGGNGAFWAADDCYDIANILTAALKKGAMSE